VERLVNPCMAIPAMANDSIKIDLGKNPGLHGLMQNRGAPKHLLKASFNLTNRDVSPARHENFRTVMPSTQLLHLKKTLLHPTYGSYWMLIGTEMDGKAAMSCSLAIMLSATLKNIREPHMGARPLLWNLYGGRWDKLRDDEQFRSSMGRIGLLILANLSIDSTPEKIEKAVDLLHMYSSTPRVLVVSGCDPMRFAVEKLYQRPSRVLYVKKRSSLHQV